MSNRFACIQTLDLNLIHAGWRDSENRKDAAKCKTKLYLSMLTHLFRTDCELTMRSTMRGERNWALASQSCCLACDQISGIDSTEELSAPRAGAA